MCAPALGPHMKVEIVAVGEPVQAYTHDIPTSARNSPKLKPATVTNKADFNLSGGCFPICVPFFYKMYVKLYDF